MMKRMKMVIRLSLIILSMACKISNLRIGLQILQQLCMEEMIIWKMMMKTIRSIRKYLINKVSNYKSQLLLKHKRKKNYNISDVFMID